MEKKQSVAGMAAEHANDTDICRINSQEDNWPLKAGLLQHTGRLVSRLCSKGRRAGQKPS